MHASQPSAEMKVSDGSSAVVRAAVGARRVADSEQPACKMKRTELLKATSRGTVRLQRLFGGLRLCCVALLLNASGDKEE